jgi:LuxR family maltose regulon positive regulatory protein
VSAVNCAAFVSEAYYEADRLVEAHEALANRLDLLRFSSPEPMLCALIVHSRLVARQVSAEQALERLAEHESQCREMSLDRPLAYVLAEQAHIYLLKNQPASAQKLQLELDDLSDRYRDAAGFMAEVDAIAGLAAGRIALALGDWAQALKQINRLRQHGIAFSRQKEEVLADLLTGIALAGLGQGSESAACLTTGITAAQRLGLVRTLLDEGNLLREALLKLQPHLSPGVVSHYLADILLRWETMRPDHRSVRDPQQTAQDQGIKPREIEILQLLGLSMSNKRIALTLNITLETVKWNLKGIFSKLGVSSRYDAVVTARRLNLIE